jgi:hypothetical protein
MDHAEAHERLADLALEPDGIDRLDPARVGGTRTDATRVEDRALAEHVRGCPTCSADVTATRALRDRLRLALTGVDATAVEPIATPDWLREAVVESARREPRLAVPAPEPPGRAAEPTSTGRRAGPRLPRWSASRWAAGIAAGLAIALLGGVAGSALQRPRDGGPEASLAAVVATLDRVLAAADHRLVQLTTPEGAAAGSAAWSSSDFAVLTSSLAAPPGDRVYRCWLVWSGKWASVGVMEFVGVTAYWTGPTGEWATVLAEPGTRFVVTLEPTGAPAARPTGGTVLQASLSS